MHEGLKSSAHLSVMLMSHNYYPFSHEAQELFGKEKVMHYHFSLFSLNGQEVHKKSTKSENRLVKARRII